MNKPILDNDTLKDKYKISILPMYILAAYQTFITKNDAQIFAMVLYNLCITLSYVLSSLYPLKHIQHENFYLQQLCGVNRLIIPCTVLLSIGFIDNVIGVALVVLFLHFALKPIDSFKPFFVIIFVALNITRYDQLQMINSTVAIDTKYNYENAFIIINGICFFILSYRDSSQRFEAWEISFLGIIPLSFQWIRDSTSSIPLMLVWFNSDDYKYLWSRLFICLSLIGTIPNDYNLRSFIVDFSVSCIIGVGLNLLGGPTILLISASLLKICLYDFFSFVSI